jgi:hypothetical protein
MSSSSTTPTPENPGTKEKAYAPPQLGDNYGIVDQKPEPGPPEVDLTKYIKTFAEQVKDNKEVLRDQNQGSPMDVDKERETVHVSGAAKDKGPMEPQGTTAKALGIHGVKEYKESLEEKLKAMK